MLEAQQPAAACRNVTCAAQRFFSEKPVVPTRDIRFTVTAEAGRVQVQTVPLRRFDQAIQLRERRSIGLRRQFHELAELQMDANDVVSESLDVLEVRAYGLPFPDPVVFDLPPVVAVVDTPRMKRRSRPIQPEPTSVPT